jgi:hypothetical protein
MIAPPLPLAFPYFILMLLNVTVAAFSIIIIDPSRASESTKVEEVNVATHPLQ